jgi:hypothetical protein
VNAECVLYDYDGEEQGFVFLMRCAAAATAVVTRKKAAGGTPARAHCACNKIKTLNDPRCLTNKKLTPFFIF